MDERQKYPFSEPVIVFQERRLIKRGLAEYERNLIRSRSGFTTRVKFMVCDEDATIYRIDVDHLHSKRLLQISANAMDPGRSMPTGVRALRVFLHLYEPHAVFVDNDKIDRAAALRGWEHPVPLPHKMLGANKLAHIAVNVPLVRHTRRCGSAQQSGRHVCLPGWPTGCRVLGLRRPHSLRPSGR